MKQEKYKVDQNKLREYFPLDVVTKGLLEIYQELLGLIFTELPDAPTWHPEVQTFEVRNDAKGQELVGYFYLDMYALPCVSISVAYFFKLCSFGLFLC